MNADNTQAHSSWPFPAAGHFKRGAATKGEGPEASPAEEHDHAEQELVDEQLERDRKAAQAVDSKFKDKGKKPG